MFHLREPIVVAGGSVRVGARPERALVRTRVGAFSTTQLLLPLAAAATGGVFGGVLWGLKGILLGGAAGAILGVVASSTPKIPAE